MDCHCADGMYLRGISREYLAFSADSDSWDRDGISVGGDRKYGLQYAFPCGQQSVAARTALWLTVGN